MNGVAAPLYYAAPGQLNVQIPYETTANNPAMLSINNNGQVTTQSFQVAAAAPGNFHGFHRRAGSHAEPRRVGKRSLSTSLARGRFLPAISDGAAPAASTPLADLPKPAARTIVTIGGTNAAIDFIGIPSGLVGVTQINVQVPNGIAAGLQPVVVTVGEVASAPATITITN